MPPAVVAAMAPKKVTPLKPPVTRSKTRNLPVTTSVAAADADADAAAPVEVDNDTDGLAELPTDSESEVTDSEQGGRKHSIGGTMTINLRRGKRGIKSVDQVLKHKSRW